MDRVVVDGRETARGVNMDTDSKFVTRTTLKHVFSTSVKSV